MPEFIFSTNLPPKIPAFENCRSYTPEGKPYQVSNSSSSDTYDMTWGLGIYDKFNLTGEYGFFRDAIWLDKVGIYKDSSLTTQKGLEYISQYTPPFDLIPEVIASQEDTKYPQPACSINWDGVVLIGQNGMDCNISYQKPNTFEQTKGYGRYMEWYEAMCQLYGKSLYVKLHPFVAKVPPYADIFEDIAKKYGCKCGVCDLSILHTASKVIAYSSTMILDCWMRDIDIEYHAECFFHNVPEGMEKQFVNFLMWKYCVPLEMKEQEWYDILRLYRDTDSLYPLPEEKSWGQWFCNKHNIMHHPS